MSTVKPRAIRVLLVEDNPGDALLIREMLRDAGRDSFRLEVTERLRDVVDHLKGGEIDIILLDLSLPDSRGLSTLAHVRAMAPVLPVVVLTGLDDEDVALEAVRQGAQDYLVKGRFDERLLARSIRYAIERKTMERALRSSEATFRSLVNASLVGILIVRDGRVVYRNPEQERLFGDMPPGFELKEFRDVDPDDEAKFKEFCDAVSSGAPRPLEMDLRFSPRGKGSLGVDLRWVRCRTCAMEYEGAQAVLVNMMDITRAKEMERVATVQEKMAVLGHVSSGIAHEIRNPLSGINIYLSALEAICADGGSLDAERKAKAEASLEGIRSASARIESVVRKILDFSRPSQPVLEPVDLNRAVEEAIDLSRHVLARRGVALDRSNLGKLPECRADAHLFSQVLLNLLTNACQAMEKSQGPKVVRIASSVEGRRIVIRVADSGPGVPAAQRERIFDPFYTTKKEGYGIGLSFSRRVIGDHGGALTVGSGEEGGAEFRIELPLNGSVDSSKG